MDKLAANWLETFKARIQNDVSYVSFIENETYLAGKQFSWIGHEYQKYITEIIESTPGCEICIIKNSQIGLSEIIIRIILARMAMRPGRGVLLSFPSRQLSSEIFKTRWSPIIEESPRLRNLIDAKTDSASVKMFANHSVAYALSGNPNSKTTLISRPISDIVIDEIDRQDADIVNSYGSRTTHTPHDQRLVVKLSTPTAAGVGIDAELGECRVVHTPVVVCELCGEGFEPDFFVDVVVPGWDRRVEELTKKSAAGLDIDSAYLRCPSCLGKVSERRYEWRVDVNNSGVKGKIGVRLTPFIAPQFIRIADLVNSWCTFSDKTEFMNQKLGLPASIQDSTVAREDILFEIPEDVRGRYVLGVDMGKICHIMKGVLRNDLSLHVVEANVVKLSEFEEFFEDYVRKTAFSAMVMDSQPYSDIVYRLVRKYPRLYSAIYVDPSVPIPELYKLKLVDKHNEVVRQVAINKNPAFDLMVNSMKSFISFSPTPFEGMIIQHFLDMRRVRDYSHSAAGVFKWVKSKGGEDHFWHTMLYLFIASKLATADLVSDVQFPIKIGKMRVTS